MTQRLTRRSLIAGATAMAIWPNAAKATERFRAHGAGSGPDHGAWSDLLRSYLRVGGDGINRVDYGAFKAAGHGALKTYVGTLEAAAPTQMARDDQFAYWVNLYNAKTIDVVLDHYPVKSIREINLGGSLFGRGPWRKKLMAVEGVSLSLDDVEHEILRPYWGDARIHYAVNCASIGCPNLQPQAFTAQRLSARLDAAAADYINHPRGVAVGARGLTASKIYDWFAEDFGTQNGLRDHWRRYATSRLARQLDANPKISGYVYDWALNDA